MSKKYHFMVLIKIFSHCKMLFLARLTRVTLKVRMVLVLE